MKNLSYILLLVISLYGCNLSSAEKKSEEDSLQYYPPTPAILDKKEFREYHRLLTAFFDTTLLKTNFNGAILIAKQGVVLYEKYIGKADLRKPDSLTDSTSLHIASTGKTFTAIAVLKLVEEGKISLTDSLNKFFPGFPYPGITVKMLLSHRSGLPNYLYFMSNSKWDKKQYASNEDMLNMLYTEKPNRSFSPDSRFNYCNTNFALLALIVERVTGKKFPDYMQEKYFGPLHMKHTYVFTLKDTLTATPSFNGNNTYWGYDFLDATYGDKNIYSTPQDLLKWDQALYTNHLLNAALLDSAFSPHSFEKPSVHNYGYGWRLQLLPNGKKIIYHFGKWHGFNAAFARLTDEQVTIIIMGNKFNRNIYTTAHLCYDLFGNYLQQKTSVQDESENPESPANTRQLKLKKP